MLITLIPLLFTAVAGYYMYTKFVSKRLDCPKNNPDIQGLEKDDVKNLVKETEKQKKDLDAEIKTLNGEIKSESDNDKKAEKTEQLAVEYLRAREVADAEHEVIDADYARHGARRPGLRPSCRMRRPGDCCRASRERIGPAPTYRRRVASACLCRLSVSSFPWRS